MSSRHVLQAGPCIFSRLEGEDDVVASRSSCYVVLTPSCTLCFESEETFDDGHNPVEVLDVNECAIMLDGATSADNEQARDAVILRFGDHSVGLRSAGPAKGWSTALRSVQLANVLHWSTRKLVTWASQLADWVPTAVEWLSAQQMTGKTLAQVSALWLLSLLSLSLLSLLFSLFLLFLH
eukprot:SAG31_NODE_3741_length_3931_cov_27.802714_4_plen_180_part_00